METKTLLLLASLAAASASVVPLVATGPTRLAPAPTPAPATAEAAPKTKALSAAPGIEIPLAGPIVSKAPEGEPGKGEGGSVAKQDPSAEPDEPEASEEAEATLEIVDIHGIQVVQRGLDDPIEPIPFIEGKRTMFRVFVSAPAGWDTSRRVECQLLLNGALAETVDAYLVPDGRLARIQDPSNRSQTEPPFSLFGDAFKEDNPEGITSDSDLAFNFTLRQDDGTWGVEMPHRLSVEARLRVDGQLVGSRTEESGREFTIQEGRSFRARILFFSHREPARNQLSLEDLDDDDRGELVEMVRRSLLARYPLTESGLSIEVRQGLVRSRSFPEEGTREVLDALAGRSWDREGDDADALFVFTEDFILRERDENGNFVRVRPSGYHSEFAGPGGPNVNILFLPAVDGRDADPAHEAGHAFLGPGHENERMVDGWDAGGYQLAEFTGEFVRPASTWSTTGFYRLLSQGVNPVWISAEEYEVLLGALSGPR